MMTGEDDRSSSSQEPASSGTAQKAADPPSSSPITRLPPELFDTLLSHVPPHLLQRTALSLLQVFPDYPLSDRHLWRHLQVHRPQQIMPLWKRLKEEGKKEERGMLEHVDTFTMNCWKGDADILNNALRCLPDVKVMMLNLGTNFAPEHLEEMFDEPRYSLKRLEMRFRPYVEQASYYQFLAGSYFDTSVETMRRRWPEIPSFTHLSIIQDPPPRKGNPLEALTDDLDGLSTSDTPNSTDDSSLTPDPPAVTKTYTGQGPFPYLPPRLQWTKPKTFAQPIVFFDVKCLSRLGQAPVSANLTHLRLRVPSREIAFLLLSDSQPGKPSTVFPALRYLDISTTNVRVDSVLTALLKGYHQLEHLVLDRVNLFGFSAKERGAEMCHDLGSMCVTSALTRGKERERAIAAWEVGQRTREAMEEAARRSNQSNQEESEADRLARVQAEERERAIVLSRSRRGHRSAAQSGFSLRDRPVRTSRIATTAIPAGLTLAPQEKAYFVLPPLPTLKSISIGGEANHVPTARLAEWQTDFQAGWRDGLSKTLGWAAHVGDKYERAKKKADEWLASQSKIKGKGKSLPKPPTDIRLYRFPDLDEERSSSDPEDPLAGLVEVQPVGKEYLEPYKLAVADAEIYAATRQTRPPCLLCTTPDCEGPARKGQLGERVDGRGGMDGKHEPGCGHVYGRAIWGWDGDL